MATTTSTTWTNSVLPEVIEQLMLAAPRPKSVASRLISSDSIEGLPTLSKAYPREGDLGAASAGTEGTNLTSSTTHSQGTQLALSPTEGGAVYALFTNRMASSRVPGVGNVNDIFQRQNPAELARLLAPEVQQHTYMILEKLEVDVNALLDDFTDTAGATTVDFSVANAEAAIYELSMNETIHEDWGFLLHPRQISDLRRDVAITSGGLGGGVWSTDVQSIVNFNPDLSRVGLRGALFGIPVYETSDTVNPDPNSGADVAGALMLLDGSQGPSAIQMLENASLFHFFELDATNRGMELVSTYEYAVGERMDEGGVSIITDA